jgi:hypothetical protein
VPVFCLVLVGLGLGLSDMECGGWAGLFKACGFTWAKVGTLWFGGVGKLAYVGLGLALVLERGLSLRGAVGWMSETSMSMSTGEGNDLVTDEVSASISGW